VSGRKALASNSWQGRPEVPDMGAMASCPRAYDGGVWCALQWKSPPPGTQTADRGPEQHILPARPPVVEPIPRKFVFRRAIPSDAIRGPALRAMKCGCPPAQYLSTLQPFDEGPGPRPQRQTRAKTPRRLSAGSWRVPLAGPSAELGPKQRPGPHANRSLRHTMICGPCPEASRHV